jgi:hypothetical protein
MIDLGSLSIGDIRKDLIAFSGQSHGHRLVHETVCPVGWIFRPPRPFESTLIPISRVFHSIKSVDNGLLLLMIKRVGLAKHDILEYLRLRFGHKGKVSRLG